MKTIKYLYLVLALTMMSCVQQQDTAEPTPENYWVIHEGTRFSVSHDGEQFNSDEYKIKAVLLEDSWFENDSNKFVTMGGLAFSNYYTINSWSLAYRPRRDGRFDVAHQVYNNVNQYRFIVITNVAVNDTIDLYGNFVPGAGVFSVRGKVGESTTIFSERFTVLDEVRNAVLPSSSAPMEQTIRFYFDIEPIQ